jgi:hypothetical protein
MCRASLKLRYTAFTSIEHAGPSPDGIDAVRALVDDEVLGPSARRLLSAWHV